MLVCHCIHSLVHSFHVQNKYYHLHFVIFFTRFVSHIQYNIRSIWVCHRWKWNSWHQIKSIMWLKFFYWKACSSSAYIPIIERTFQFHTKLVCSTFSVDLHSNFIICSKKLIKRIRMKFNPLKCCFLFFRLKKLKLLNELKMIGHWNGLNIFNREKNPR